MIALADPRFAEANYAATADWSATRFTYAAAETQTKRKNARIDSRSEDLILDRGKRAILGANARDISRNFAIACWMIRRHLDYVTRFEFHGRSGNTDWDLQLETFMERWSRRYNCDAAAKHRFGKMIRLAECRRVIDGDVGLLKLANGTLQGIESDRIRDPAGNLVDQDGRRQWIHGVKVDPAGRALAYAIWSRNGAGWKFDRYVTAGRLCMLGYYDRFDQVRGISPLASALNPLRDTYENFDLALAKAKVEQLFAMIIYSSATDGVGATTYAGNEDEDEADKYTVDFGAGPVKLELDPADRAEFLESKHPSSEFQKFTELIIQVALKALDIPFSFYSENFTNFFGSRAAWLHYERACKDKQEDLLELLNQITIWRMQLAILDGQLTLPRGWTMEQAIFEWVPVGMPWWDPAKEIRGDMMAVRGGFDNPQRITKARGKGDWYDNVDRIAEAQEYARKKGVVLSFNPDTENPVVIEPPDA